MASDKNIVAMGLFLRVEASYGAGAAVTGSTDAVKLIEPKPEFSIEYGYDGARPSPQGTAGTQRRVAPSVRSTKGTISVEACGRGLAYTSVITPPGLHQLFLASGFSGSLQASQWVYKPGPVSAAPTSLAGEVYNRGEKRVISGAYCDMKASSDGALPTVFAFDLQGIIGLPSTQASPPDFLLLTSGTLPPKNENIALTIGGVSSFKVRSYSFELGRELIPRVDVNASGALAGFAPGRRNPKLTVTVEAVALSTFDPYASFSNGTATAVSFTVGTVAGNKFTYSFPQAQIMAVAEPADGTVALWELQFDCPCSTPTTDDDLVITAG